MYTPFFQFSVLFFAVLLPKIRFSTKTQSTIYVKENQLEQSAKS